MVRIAHTKCAVYKIESFRGELGERFHRERFHIITKVGYGISDILELGQSYKIAGLELLVGSLLRFRLLDSGYVMQGSLVTFITILND